MTFEIDNLSVFVLGNGPSLRLVPFDRLSKFSTIGLNAAYRYWRKIDWYPTYYACLDEVVGMSHKSEIASLITEGRIKKFLLRESLIEALGTDGVSEKVYNFDKLRKTEELLKTPSITTGSGAACWAAVLGYNKVIIAGVDLNYLEIVDGAQRLKGAELEIQQQSSNPNYFFDDYQQPGDRYNVPNTRPDLHLNAWREAAWFLAASKVRVVNANPDSEVTYFPYVGIDDLIGGGAVELPAREPLTEYTVSGLAKLLYEIEAEKKWFSRQRNELLSEVGKKKGELLWYQDELRGCQEMNQQLMVQRSFIRRLASRVRRIFERKSE